MELGLKGKTAVVTGASQGIGRAIARALHREGVALVVVSRSAARLRAAAEYIAGDPPSTGAGGAPGASARPPVGRVEADLALRAEAEHVAQEAQRQLGHVDYLVNNAGSARTASFFEMTDAEVEEVVQVKELGYVRLIRALAPHMMERRSGAIVNIVGTTARTPTADFIVGSMINAALVNFTRGISRELASYNVRINAISPGWTLTEQQQRSFAMQADARGVSVESVIQQAARGIPLRRLVATEEIAALTLLLLSDHLASMTGEEILIDGGATPSI
jgi:NAD(P)-dependent dehydrogenase (short-subunit alcohol dehydrogenase family)